MIWVLEDIQGLFPRPICFDIVLVRSKLDYGAHVCTSPPALPILDPVQNECLRLANVEFRSSPIGSLYVESNVLPIDLRSS